MTTVIQPEVIQTSAVTPSTRRGGEVRLLLSPGSGGARTGLTGTVVLQPAEYMAEHYHPYSEEHVLVVHGEVNLSVNGRPIRLGAGDALAVPQACRHRLENIGNTPAEVVFHLSPLAPEPRLGHVDTEASPGLAERT